MIHLQPASDGQVSPAVTHGMKISGARQDLRPASLAGGGADVIHDSQVSTNDTPPLSPDPSSRPRRLLLLSDDHQLSMTRQQLIERAGFAVVCCVGFERRQCLQPLDVAVFSAALLCQTIDTGEAVFLARQLKLLHPEIHLIRSSLEPVVADGVYNQVLLPPIPPTTLINALTAVGSA